MQPLSNTELKNARKDDVVEAYKALRDAEPATLEPSEKAPDIVPPEVTRVYLGHCGEHGDVESVRVAPFAASWQVRAGAMVLDHRGTWVLDPDAHSDGTTLLAFRRRTAHATVAAARAAWLGSRS